MKPIRFLLWPLFISLISCQYKSENQLLHFVDPMIGTAQSSTPSTKTNPGDQVDRGQTIPAVTAPFGMTQWTAQTRETENKCVAPFYYEDKKIQGFRATHWLNGSCTQDYGSFTLMPVSGKFNFQPSQRQTEFKMDSNRLSPAYCKINIPAYHVNTEFTSTRRCGIFRFSWSEVQDPAIVIDVNNDEGEGFIRIIPEKREIIAENPVRRIYNGKGKPAGISGYIVLQFNCDFEKAGIYQGDTYFADSLAIQKQSRIGAVIRLKPDAGQMNCVKIGTSFTSIENARKNLESEIPDWNFNKAKSSLENQWANLLGKIKVSGGTYNENRKFYTALYHSLLHPRLFSDADGTYKGFDGDSTFHKANGFDYYTDFSAWDTYRAQMPLLSIIAPKEYQDMVTSLIVMAEQGGWLPIFPMWNNYTSAMIGDHCTAIIGDAIMKGFQVDTTKAWFYLRKNAFEVPADLSEYTDGKGRRSLTSYIQYGYIPLEDSVPYAFHDKEQVSRTMEYAYDDWVIAQVAKKLDRNQDFQKLSERSRNYARVFDPEKGWICGRLTDGSFTGEFGADRHLYYITEGTPAQYTWYVPQDIPGLMKLMGGQQAFHEKLRNFIEKREYWHGNEPSHHIPYLFNYTGHWEMTQKIVKDLLNAEYTSEPGGISGNDDAGQMSAWYVFSAMGFYPVCPGSNEYQLSSPQFKEVILTLDKEFYPGGKFILTTKNNYPDKIYKSVSYNGKDNGTILKHEQIKQGGKLVFH